MMAFFGALANTLDKCYDKGILEEKLVYLVVQIIIGTIAGLIFGMFGCWLIGENVYAVAGISGAGSILGIKGVKNLASYMEKYIKSKLQ